MGKGAAKSAQSIQNKVGSSAFNISDTTQTQLMPNLKTTSDYYKSILSGDPQRLSRAVGPQIEMSRMVYDNARRQIEQTTPSGGIRTQALTDLQTRRAGDVSHILNGGVHEALQHLESLGQFGTQASLQGLGVAGNAGDSLARLSAAKAQAVGQGIAGIAGGVGGIIGMRAGRPPTTSGGGYGPQLPSPDITASGAWPSPIKPNQFFTSGMPAPGMAQPYQLPWLAQGSAGYGVPVPSNGYGDTIYNLGR